MQIEVSITATDEDLKKYITKKGFNINKYINRQILILRKCYKIDFEFTGSEMSTGLNVSFGKVSNFIFSSK